jgi:hypothetical protein
MLLTFKLDMKATGFASAASGAPEVVPLFTGTRTSNFIEATPDYRLWRHVQVCELIPQRFSRPPRMIEEDNRQAITLQLTAPKSITT